MVFRETIRDELFLFGDSLKSVKYDKKYTVSILVQFPLFLYMLIYAIRTSKKIHATDLNDLAIARSNVGLNILRKSCMCKGSILVDNGPKCALVRYLPVKKKISILVKSFFEACKLINILYKDDTIEPDVYYYYVFRLIHYYQYKLSLEIICSNYKVGKLFSSQIADRFAFCEYEVCKENRIERICIPHGLEPLKELPYSFPADIFYCHSKEAKEYLKNMYKTSIFYFSSSLMENIMSFRNDYKKRNNIVFFTQPHSVNMTEKTVLYIKLLKKYVDKSNKFENLFIKLHPSEDKNFYHKVLPDVKYIENYEKSICSNVCISFFSTCLLEAIYNNSLSISIMEDELEIPFCEVTLNNNIIKVKNDVELIKTLEALVL